MPLLRTRDWCKQYAPRPKPQGLSKMSADLSILVTGQHGFELLKGVHQVRNVHVHATQKARTSMDSRFQRPQKGEDTFALQAYVILRRTSEVTVPFQSIRPSPVPPDFF